MQAHRDLILYLYRHGYIVGIPDYWDSAQMTMFDAPMQAIEEIEAVDGGEDFVIYNSDGELISTVVLAIGYNDPEENVCDWSYRKNRLDIVGQWMDEAQPKLDKALERRYR